MNKRVRIVVQSPSHVRLFVTPWTAARQASMSLTISWHLPKFISSDALFSFCPQSFPASGTFPMSHLFTSDDQNIGASASASASVLPVNIRGLFPLGWTGWISLQSKGFPRVFSNTTVQKHQFFHVQPSIQSNSHIRT